MNKMVKWIGIVAITAICGALMAGCGSGVESNADALKGMEEKPSNNPDRPPVDAANTEFGGEKKGGG